MDTTSRARYNKLSKVTMLNEEGGNPSAKLRDQIDRAAKLGDPPSSDSKVVANGTIHVG